MPNRLKKIISGGQSGADRAAHDAAIAAAIPIGGFVPSGRWAEDGPIHPKYSGLHETESSDPSERTRMNVITSDGTVIFSHGKLRGGSKLTWLACRNERKPVLHIDLLVNSTDAAANKIRLWLRNFDIEKLNVAGPRASKDPDIYAAVRGVLELLFKGIKK
ncbi:MAG: putative molybdenum carrier protein [Acidobacteria bacterium]|nr:putative molybdenum carrier protein [Acidobacteriota bacterium]